MTDFHCEKVEIGQKYDFIGGVVVVTLVGNSGVIVKPFATFIKDQDLSQQLTSTTTNTKVGRNICRRNI